jgi:hypothetical protein
MIANESSQLAILVKIVPLSYPFVNNGFFKPSPSPPSDSLKKVRQ